jgi:hypothetical protein
MKNIKLFDMLARLKHPEWRAFIRFVESKCNKQDALPLKTLQLLDKYHPEFYDSKISKEKLFRKLFPGQAYHENKLNKLFSEIIHLYEDFAVVELSAACPATHALKLSEYYLQRSMYKYFVSNQKQAFAIISGYPEGSKKNLLKYEYEVLQLHYQSKLDERNLSFQVAYDALQEFATAEQLRWQNLAIIHLPKPLSEHETNNLFFLAHQQLRILLDSQSEEDFEKLFAWARQNLAAFEKEQSREILGVLKDFCIRKLADADSRYYAQLLDIYEFYISLGIICEADGYIKTATYKNYITCCLKLKLSQRAEAFLEEYKNCIDPELVQDVYLYNKASILFERGDLDTVHVLLRSAKFEDLFYKISARRLQIKLFYEMARRDASLADMLDDALNAFKKYIYTSSDLPMPYQQANKSFIRYTSSLIENNLSAQKSVDLEQEISTAPHLAEREWLLSKLESCG